MTLCPEPKVTIKTRHLSKKANWEMNIACAEKLDYINVIYLIDWSCGREVQFPFSCSYFIASHSVIYNLYISKKCHFPFSLCIPVFPLLQGMTGSLRQLSPIPQFNLSH